MEETNLNTEYKIETLKYFNKIWQTGLMTKYQAYQKILCGRKIDQLNKVQCEKLINKLKKDYPDLYETTI